MRQPLSRPYPWRVVRLAPVVPRASAPPPAEAARSEVKEVVYRHHCAYEIHLRPCGATIIARPQSASAKAWMASRHLQSARVVCRETEAHAWVSGQERAIDVARPRDGF